MRRIIGLLTVLMLCLSVAIPALAAEDGFVPSIAYKPNPEVVPVIGEDGGEYVGVIRDGNGEIVDYVGHGCLRITPIAHVWDEEIEVPEVIEKLLLKVYEGLKNGSMKISYEKHEADLEPNDMVIRDLFDARWVCEEHRAMIEKEGNTFELTFELGVVADAQIYVMTYDEAADEWSPVVRTVNNGDGTVTCTFEHLCAIEFSMPVAAASAPSDSGQAPNVLRRIILLLLALLGLLGVLVSRKKKAAV